ncbi:MAG: hypothetical protein M1296_02755 [Chloroflexi bacterium]|nr:hypothetical protein [Chloroflexota bacterium]
MATTATPQFVALDSAGRTVVLTDVIGRGGEGAVYTVRGQSHLVAKLYHHDPNPVRMRKLQAMVRLQDERLIRLAAWPLDTLHLTRGGSVQGFVMPGIQDHKAIHLLYGPKSRKQEFPEASWHFLIHAANNLARAFAKLHELGIVIGDVNHGNVLVSPRATVMLIDCDSFQVIEDVQVYPCDVGVSTHTPPELQGHSLHGVVRTVNHDNFGLAVLIFQLLFMGRHPYSGQAASRELLTLEQAIQRHCFVYGRSATALQLQAPPGTARLDILPASFGALFERAFSSQAAVAGRPSARDWTAALSTLESQLEQCTSNAYHQYPSPLRSCPWCALDATTGAPLFNFKARTGRSTNFPFSLIDWWRQVEAVPTPEPLSAELLQIHVQIPPSPGALQFARGVRQRRLTLLLLVILLAVLPLLLAHAAITLQPAGRLLLLTLIVTPIVIESILSTLGYHHWHHHLRTAEQAWATFARYWEEQTGVPSFHKQWGILATEREHYQSLTTLRQTRLQTLTRTTRTTQLQRFLDQHHIATACIPAIGPARAAILASWNIETAADVNPQVLERIPNVGPKLQRRLLEWREQVARSFIFDPRRSIEPQEVAKIDQEIEAKRQLLVQDLERGLAELKLLTERITKTRVLLRPELRCQVQAVARAKVDLDAALHL